MRKPSTSEQVLDLLLLRMSPPDYAVDQPYYTTGNIVAAGLIRVVLIAVIIILLDAYWKSSTSWWYIALFAIWGLGLYPAWVQYNKFNESVDQISEGTLCGACRHFNRTNQLCMILDEHVTNDQPPCEGEAWEPIS